MRVITIPLLVLLSISAAACGRDAAAHPQRLAANAPRTVQAWEVEPQQFPDASAADDIGPGMAESLLVAEPAKPQSCAK